MRIEDARSAVVAYVQNFRPSAEFPVPNSLVDFMLFQEAAAAIRADRVVLPADWMFTRFTCLAAESEKAVCGSNWKVALPFVPAEVYDPIGLITMSDSISKASNSITIRLVSMNAVAVSDGMVDPPSRDRPAAVLSGNDLYLIGRNDFSMCKISVNGVVGGLSEDYECDPDANLPVPMGGGSMVIDSVAEKIITSLFGVPEDKIEDNESDQREPTAL